ncbi:unnamed protein product, partial [Staurois parvus]
MCFLIAKFGLPRPVSICGRWVVLLNVYIFSLSPGFLQVWCCLVLYGQRWCLWIC